jgi:hypothetical protein
VRSKTSILVSWYTDPTVIPPFVLAQGQVTVGPKLRPDQPRLMYAGRTPIGVYDLKVALASQGLATRYDLVVIYADPSGMNFPLNLDAFEKLDLTQEFLSHMLGVRRTSVTLVAHTLQKSGLIRYTRGKIEILDRPGVEECACECYEVLRSEIDKALSSDRTV